MFARRSTEGLKACVFGRAWKKAERLRLPHDSKRICLLQLQTHNRMHVRTNPPSQGSFLPNQLSLLLDG